MNINHNAIYIAKTQEQKKKKIKLIFTISNIKSNSSINQKYILIIPSVV